METLTSTDKLLGHVYCMGKTVKIIESQPYRKIPVITPGLLQVRKGFGWAYITEGLISGVGGLKRYKNVSE